MLRPTMVNSEKVDLIVHGKMTFLFTTEYVKIGLQLIHSRPPYLIFNLEETLIYITDLHI